MKQDAYCHKINILAEKKSTNDILHVYVFFKSFQYICFMVWYIDEFEIFHTDRIMRIFINRDRTKDEGNSSIKQSVSPFVFPRRPFCILDPRKYLLTVRKQRLCCVSFRLLIFVRFPFVFDFICILFRIARRLSVGKVLSCWLCAYDFILPSCFLCSFPIWTSSWDYDTYRIGEQRRLWRDCAYSHS